MVAKENVHRLKDLAEVSQVFGVAESVGFWLVAWACAVHLFQGDNTLVRLRVEVEHNWDPIFLAPISRFGAGVQASRIGVKQRCRSRPSASQGRFCREKVDEIPNAVEW